ncbi:ATP-binding protein [Streptomyces sp. NPDC059373]
MVRAGSPPGDRRPTPVLAWLLPTVVTVGAAAVAVAVAPADARTPVAWCGAVASLAVALVAAEAARRGRALRALREQAVRQVAELRHSLARQEEETIRLARQQLPHAVSRLQQGEFVDDVLKGIEHFDEGLTPEFQAARMAVLRSVLEAVSAEEDIRESSQRAFVNVARRVQAIANQQASDLRKMEDRHGGSPAVFGDLLKLDHGTALIGRLADSISVLGGARPGRQWSKVVALFSVMRGAMSRITDYQRVDLHKIAQVGIVGPGVEPLIHALAEVLDNATRYSPPQTRVHVSAVEVQTGIAIEIEDGGVGLSPDARDRAEQAIAEAQAGIDLKDLGETPRLGFAVVGRLCRAYGFQISLRSSAYGGVRAVLIVPSELITTAPATGIAHGIGAASNSQSAVKADPSRMPVDIKPVGPLIPGPQPSPPAVSMRDDDDIPVVTERTPSGLPQRRRRAAFVDTGAAPAAQPSAATVTASSDNPAQTEPVQPGLWLAAFTSGVNGESPTAPPASKNSDDSLDESEKP